MPTGRFQGGVSRCVHSGSMNNRGGSSTMKDRQHRDSQVLMSKLRNSGKDDHRAYRANRDDIVHHFDDEVIVAGAPNSDTHRNTNDLRFTIPDIPQNKDILRSQVVHAHEVYDEVVHELSTSQRVRRCVTDPEHVEEL